MTGAQIAAVLRGYWYLDTTEAALQAAIAEALKRGGVEFTEEERLDGQSRIDFLAGDVGIELKVAGGMTAVRRQLCRYGQYDRIRELVLVTTMLRHGTIRHVGVPLHVVTISDGLR